MGDIKRIGMLTGGGDAPGNNGVIRSVTIGGIREGWEVVGFRLGWKGLLESNSVGLSVDDVADIHREGGTILGSSRTNPFKVKDGPERCFENMKKAKVDALVAIGGEDTLGVAKKLCDLGGKVVGVPKTIDNDVNATDYTFGFDTAIDRVCEALDRLHSTTKAHQRVMVVEVMGRHAGWMTLHGGIAGGAHIILIPEVPFDTDKVCELVKKRYAAGRTYALIAVAEGAEDPKLKEELQRDAEKDEFGHIRLGAGKTISEVLYKEIEKRTGIETRNVILGHLQRGGAPSAYDRVMTTKLGLRAVGLIKEGKYGRMAAIRSGNVSDAPLAEGVGTLKTVPVKEYEEAKLFFDLEGLKPKS